VVFSGTPVSSTNKTDSHDFDWNIAESGVKHHKPKPKLLKVLMLNKNLFDLFLSILFFILI
jgi:hypothetical protein